MAIDQPYFKVPKQLISHDIVSQKEFINDPYFGLTDDPKVYLTRLINSQLNVLFSDSCLKDIYGGIIDGLESNLYSVKENVFTIRVKPGLFVVDSTLVEIHDTFDIPIRITNLDITNGYTAVAIITEYRFINDATIDNPVKFRAFLFNPTTRELRNPELWDDNLHTQCLSTIEIIGDTVIQEPFYLFKSITYNVPFHNLGCGSFIINTLETTEVSVDNTFNTNYCIVFKVYGENKSIPMAFRTITTNALLHFINGNQFLKTKFDVNKLTNILFRGNDDENLFVFSIPYDSLNCIRDQHKNLVYTLLDVADEY